MTKCLSFGLLISGLAACSAILNPPEEYYSGESDSLRTVYYGLTDSLNQAWEVLRQDDARKNARLQRLVHEMRQTDYYQADTLDSLEMLLDRLSGLTYDSVTAGNEHRVHQYDSATVAISETVIQYAEVHAEYLDNPALVYLVERILDANRSMMLYRLSYDRYSRRFNRFLDDYHAVIPTFDSSSSSVQRRFLFKLTNDSETTTP